MHERRFNRELSRLRDPERVARMEVDRVVALAMEGVEDAQTVLDIGTGTGLFAEAFAARGYTVSGVDVNPDMLPEAQRFVPSGVFHESTAERLPFEDGVFDVAFMGLLLHETDDPLAALREAHRVTQRRLVILDWPDEDQPIGPPRADRISAERIAELAAQCGFGPLQQVPLNVLVLYRLECS